MHEHSQGLAYVLEKGAHISLLDVTWVENLMACRWHFPVLVEFAFSILFCLQNFIITDALLGGFISIYVKK